MEKQMLSKEELKQVNGGYKYEKKKTDHGHGTEGHRDAIIDGVTYVGVKVVERASWLWNGIRSIF